MTPKSEPSGPKRTKAEREDVQAADLESTERVESGEERSGDSEGASEIDPQQIAALAYQYWEERGRPKSSPEEDWFRAEETLHQKRKKANGR